MSISGKVLRFHGKENLLAALHRAGRCHGFRTAVSLVEPGAHLAAARILLVGRLSQRLALVEKSLPLKPFPQLQQEQKSRYSHSHPTL